MKSETRVGKRRAVTLAMTVAVVIATFAAYVPVLSAGFVWDDDKWVSANPLLSAPDGLWRIWFSRDQPSQYFPMVYTTFRVEYALWGLDPTGYHVSNVLLHAVNALLVGWLLARLRVPGAWLAAAIFALHPVHVESVAWITERKNVLSTLFAALATFAWINHLEAPRRGRVLSRAYLVSLVFYVLALLSKTTACTLPAALALILWLRGRPLERRRWLELVPYAVLGLAMGLFTMWWERVQQGMDPTLLPLTVVERGLVAGRAIWFYLGQLVWPTELAFSYAKWSIDSTAPLQYGWPALCGFAAAGLWFYRARIGRGPAAALGFFAATLSPMLGFILLSTFAYTYVADHYQYVASIGPIALFAAGVTLTARRLGPAGRRVVMALALALLALLGTLTWRQAAMYADAETLWRDTLQKSPDSWLAHNNLGTLLRARGSTDEAVEHFRRALAVSRDLADSGARIHYNLANALAAREDFKEAIEHYQRALEIIPNHVLAVNNLGNALMAVGQLERAILRYEQAVRLDPGYAEAYYNLGNAVRGTGRTDLAIEHYRRAAREDPTLVEARISLAGLLADRGQVEEAVTRFREAVRLDPDRVEALTGLAWLLATRTDEAVEALRLAQRASELTGHRDPRALYTLAAANAAAGRFSTALSTAERALALETPDSALAERLRQQIESYRNALADERRSTRSARP